MVNAIKHTVLNSYSSSQKKITVFLGLSLIDYGSQEALGIELEHILLPFFCVFFFFLAFVGSFTDQ